MTAVTSKDRGVSRARSVEHQELLDEVRALILPAQTPGALDRAHLATIVERAEASGWSDVAMVAQYVRALASTADPDDDTRAQLSILLDRAHEEGDTVWEALCLAMGATHVVVDHRPQLARDRDLARATVLLREAVSSHEMLASAHVECATGYLDREMWDLALEHTSAAAAFLRDHEQDAWRVATAMYNRAEIQLRRLCVTRQAGPSSEVDDLAQRARAAIQRVPVELLPQDWALDLHIFENLVDAISAPRHAGARPLAQQEGAEYAAYLDLAASFLEPDAELARGHLARAIEGWDRVAHPELFLLALTRDAELEAEQTGAETAGLRLSRELTLRRHESRAAAAEAMGSLIQNEQMATEHARLRVAAEVDALTGVANRRGLAAHVDAILEGGPARDEVSLVLVDVDHFKTVNDTHGHDVGDEVLVRVAAALREFVRGTDLVVRWGGDEFLLLLDTDRVSVARRRCLEVVEIVRRDHWDDLAPGLHVTVSVGVAVGKLADLDGLRHEADLALYRAKAAGRDGVAV